MGEQPAAPSALDRLTERVQAQERRIATLTVMRHVRWPQVQSTFSRR